MLSKASISVACASIVVFLLVVYGSVMMPNLMIEGIFILGVVTFLLRYPTYGLYVLFCLFLVQASPIYLTYGILANSVTAADLAGLLILAGYVYRLARDGNSLALPAPAQAALGAVAAYFAFTCVAAVWSPAPIVEVESYIRQAVEAVALFALSLLLIRTQREARLAAASYALVAGLTAVWVIVNYSSHYSGSLYNPVLGNSYRGALPTSINPNGLSILLAAAPAFAYLATVGLPRRNQILLTALTLVPVAVSMVILTSREAFVETGLGLIAAFAVTRGYRNRLTVAAFLGLAGSALVLAIASNSVPSYFQQRFALAATDNFGGRGPGWQAGLDFFAHNPLGGLGIYGFESRISQLDVEAYIGITSPHSDYIGTLANFGIIGFALMLVMLVMLSRTSIFGTGRNPASVFVSVLFTMSLTAGSFLLNHWLWAGFATIFCYGLSTHREGEQQESASSRPALLPTARLREHSPGGMASGGTLLPARQGDLRQ